MTDTAIETATAALTAERSTLIEELARRDAAHQQSRTELSGKLARLGRAISALSGKVVALGARKPMSDEARQRIRQGLLRASAAKEAFMNSPKSDGGQPAIEVTDQKPRTKKNRLVNGRKKPSRATRVRATKRATVTRSSSASLVPYTVEFRPMATAYYGGLPAINSTAFEPRSRKSFSYYLRHANRYFELSRLLGGEEETCA